MPADEAPAESSGAATGVETAVSQGDGTAAEHGREQLVGECLGYEVHEAGRVGGPRPLLQARLHLAGRGPFTARTMVPAHRTRISPQLYARA